MSVVLLEQLLESYNTNNPETKFEVYNCILPTGLIEVGIVDTVTNVSNIKVRATQSPELSHLECIGQGASKIIDCIFSLGMSTLKIIKETEFKQDCETDGELEERSTTLCVNNE